MSEASIALNRFGMGARANEPAPAAPRRMLIDQMERFAVLPAPLAAYPRTPALGADMAAAYDAVQMEARAARREGQKADAATQELRQAARQQGRDYYIQAVGVRAQAAVASDTPFIERLVHFWANHFAVSADKQVMVGLTGGFEFDAIRPHVLGRFRDMLHAVERHPAMLLYLDQAQSVGPNSPVGQRFTQRQQGQESPRRIGLNENLAREIMELHTLGVRSVYTQADVTEFARAMTGWTVAGLGRGQGARLAQADGAAGGFAFAPRIHEAGPRTIIGKRYDQQGEAQASAVLDDLAVHPATAKHIATKLARHFAGDEPPAALVSKLETAFLKSGGDLPAVYRALIAAPEAWVPQSVKFKTPWEWSISTMRALGTQEITAQAVLGLLNQLGQPVWRPGSPAGYDDIAASWAGPDAVMRRVEAAERFASRTRETIDGRTRAAQLFPDALSATTVQAIARAESPAQSVALMLVSPEFLRR